MFSAGIRISVVMVITLCDIASRREPASKTGYHSSRTVTADWSVDE
jgi:hypothetical protein